MHESQLILQLQQELEAQKQRTADLEAHLLRYRADTQELRQRLDLRNLSLERLQSQFTLAAEAVSKLLGERTVIRQSRWARLGIALRFLPKLEDDL